MNGNLPPGYTERPLTSDGGDSGGLPPGYSLRPISKFPKITTPSEVASGAETVANKAIGALGPPDPDQHPVEFALWTLGTGMPLLGKLPGLGALAGTGLKAAALRTGLMTAAGTGAAAMAGKPIGSAALESAAVGSTGEAIAPIASKITGAGTAMAAGAGAMREQAADEVSQKALENELGITASQAQKRKAPRDLVGMGAQERKADLDALAQARQSAVREVGQKYEPIYGPIENQPVGPERLTPIGGAATESSQWLYGKGAKISPTTQKLLAKQAAMAGGSEPVEGVPSGSVVSSQIEMPDGEKVSPPVKPTTTAPSLGNTPSKIGRTFVDTPAGPQRTVQPQTIGQLRGHLGQIMTEANKPGTSALERRALMKASTPIVETLNNAIPDEQRPLLAEINNEYAQINRIFPWKGLKKISEAGTIPELGQLAFSKDNVAATSMAVPRMSEPQRQLMRRAFGSYVLSETDSPTATLSKLQQNKDTVAALYKGSPFEKIDTWRQAMIAQKKFLQGPPNLPSQQQFERGLQDVIKKSGLTPEATQAANAALAGSGTQRMPYILRYATTWGLIGAIGGWGIFGHAPELIPVAATYGAGHLGWRAIASNPEALDMYRRFVTSGWTRVGGEMFGRLMINGVNDVLQGAAPQHQVFGHVEPGAGGKALDHARAEHIAPTPSAADRAKKVSSDLSKGRIPEVHRDLSKGRLSMDETNKLVQHSSKTDAMAMFDDVPLTEA